MFSVCIPTYRSLGYIDSTLESLLKQNFTDFEVIICNDSPDDHDQLESKIAGYGDQRLKFFKNDRNLGYPGNLKKCVSLTQYNYIFLLGQDDILLESDLFTRFHAIFQKDGEIGCITRPYYWFEGNPQEPVRRIAKLEKRVVSIDDDQHSLETLFHTLGQLSGLVYRKDLITEAFHHHVFTAHIHPFLSIMKTHKCYFWDTYSIAVRCSSSQTRFLSSIYRPSPTKTWVEMFQKVLESDRFGKARRIGINLITRHFVGLAQIKNFGHLSDVFVEGYYLLRFRWKNAFNPIFWVMFGGAVLIPRSLLRPLVTLYKYRLVRRRLQRLELVES